MMSKIIVFVLIVGIASAKIKTQNVQLTDIVSHLPDESVLDEGCYVDVINANVPYNSVGRIEGKCLSVQCNDIDYDLSTCDYDNVPAGCHYTAEDLSKSFPECCGSLVCNKKL